MDIPAIDIVTIVVGFNSDYFLERCIASLAEPGVQCVLVNNSQLSPVLAEKLRGLHDNLVIVPFSSNLGFVMGNNVGLRFHAHGAAPLVGMVNPDTWFESGWSRLLRAAFRGSPDYGVIAPVQMVYEDNGKIAEWTKKVLKVDGIESLVARGELLECSWVEGSGLFVRREVLQGRDLLDPVFDIYFEEVDLCRRARLSGWKVGVLTRTRYHHAVGGSLGGADSPRRRVLKDLGQVLYSATNPVASFGMNLLDVLRILARNGMEWIHGRYPSYPTFVCRTLWMVLKKLPRILGKRMKERKLKWQLESVS